MRISEYRAVWLCVLFDLPVLTKKQRRIYTIFRRNLLKDGFTMLQYSVYIRHCASLENATVHIGRVEDTVPEQGLVSILTVTDKQYSSMKTFWGRERQPDAVNPQQLELF
ncbi:MAG: CRISPR-associated endonuclease Cas2 [Candidatus Kapabacteria bacterium]|nr:CRISPR-associated endonuclease Cas2 [Candidatus Kapabacteria bacterium]